MIISSLQDMMAFGSKIATSLHGGEIFELVGDVGAGKTTFTRGLAEGMGVTDAVQSPTFTISREYKAADGLRLVHYDFYRLGEAGIMADELAESLADPKSVVVIEWAETVTSVLPDDRVTLRIELVADDEDARNVLWHTSGAVSNKLMEGME